MINNFRIEKRLSSRLLLKLAPSYKILIPHFKQFLSSYLLKNSNFITSQFFEDKNYYSATRKTLKLSNEEDLSRILSMNAFQLFDLENKFSIDKKNIDLNYKELMRKLHPDVNNFANENISIHIIKQYNILNDPFERALLLLSVKSNITRDNLMNIMDTIPVSSSLLEQIFELDEEMKKITNIDFGISGFDKISKKNKLKIAGCIKSLENEFEKNNVSITKVLSILKELRIYQKLSDRVSSILDN
ncbi:DNAJ domain containing [Cryptosporidium sp. chipmunk genotype I]|uniref:DNAJ domain containing n=1 Tax=Cryptosporidium sp. chipmunk genotype I TaxID=1280935 RepID=UPI003519FEEE|nr:DNAJ domain containing [Cryptosporidium sp. chipmunk genotype I]